ncbi:MAG: methyltransferase domain-containing protein [Actinobacteria bacterium]|nr:methyltransferase domain-containing protein [Actinomycetota bacterium]
MSVSETWDDEADNWIKWARTPGHDVYRFYSSSFFDEIVPSPSGLVLELGCGEGRVVRDLESLGHEVVGLDPSPTMVRHARQEDIHGAYVIAPGEQLPFAEGAFDLVIAYNSLQNVEDLAKTVAEVERVLTTDGRFCMCIAHPMSDAGRFESAQPDAPFTVKGSYYGPRRVDEKSNAMGLRSPSTAWPIRSRSTHEH